MAAVAAGHLDFQVVPRQIAERGERCRQGHSPIWGERRALAIPFSPEASRSVVTPKNCPSERGQRTSTGKLPGGWQRLRVAGDDAGGGER
jgi:hypothetical protein